MRKSHEQETFTTAILGAHHASILFLQTVKVFQREDVGTLNQVHWQLFPK